MKRIEIGTKVRILRCRDNDATTKYIAADYIGHVGVVNGEASRSKRTGERRFFVEGAAVRHPELGELCWAETDLEPVEDDGDFQRFMDKAFRPVDLTIKKGVKA